MTGQRQDRMGRGNPLRLPWSPIRHRHRGTRNPNPAVMARPIRPSLQGHRRIIGGEQGNRKGLPLPIRCT
ncbi:MAG TPA: hypothetical protein VKY19_07070 [Ktedonosporobacter sp.]|nr:hypothetical protein [Ktedonosporobacter sp.]